MERLYQVKQECELFGDFGWFIQLVLAGVSFSALILKRYTEKVKRPWKVWFMDTSKQATGGSLLHFLNLSASWLMGQYQPHSNACTMYLINFLMDTCLGMVIAVLLLRACEKCLSKSETFGFKSGYYGQEPSWANWAYQIWIWLGIVIVMKGIIVSLIWFLRVQLESLGDWALSPLMEHPHLELLMVMIIIPVVSNALVFWITDNFLKSNKTSQAGEIDLELQEALDLIKC